MKNTPFKIVEFGSILSIVLTSSSDYHILRRFRFNTLIVILSLFDFVWWTTVFYTQVVDVDTNKYRRCNINSVRGRY